MLNMDVAYCDELFKDFFLITNEYVTPFLTKSFKTTVTHAAIPAMENKNVEWSKPIEAETEIKAGVETEVNFKKRGDLRKCVKEFSVDEQDEKKTTNQIVNKTHNIVNENIEQGESVPEVKHEVKKNESKKKNKKTNEKNMNKKKKVEVLQIYYKILSYKNNNAKTENTKITEKTNPFLIKQKISEKEEFQVYDDNLLNNKTVCNIYSQFCHMLNFFNCNFGENQLNNNLSNDTEVTVYEINTKNEIGNMEETATKGFDSLNKEVVKNMKITKNGKQENQTEIERHLHYIENVELTSSYNNSKEEHLMENTCFDVYKVETPNETLNNEKDSNPIRLRNSFLHMRKNQPTATFTSYSVDGTCVGETEETVTEKEGHKRKKQENGTRKEKGENKETEKEKKKKKEKKNYKKQKKNREKKKGYKKNIDTHFNATNGTNNINNPIVPSKKKEQKKKEEHIMHQKVDASIVFIQIENFSQKIEEYIADEKIFRAQKLIEHVKKYIEFYINYFTENKSKPVADKLLEYYKKNCANNNNVKYNINTLKSNIILYFLNFFHLNEMVTILNEYCYYFSIDPLVNCDISETTSENNNTACKKNSSNSDNSQANSNIEDKIAEESTLKSISHSCSNSDIEMQKEAHFFFNFPNEIDIHDLNKNKVVIVDKMYHYHFAVANIIPNNSISFDDPNTEEQVKKNSVQKTANKKKPKHIGRILKSYSRRLKKFRKHKRNKEGWIKENDKFLDLWYQIGTENNISVHVRAKLPYEINRILCILNETDVSVNWAPFLTSARKIKHFSKASSIITQLYEYPVIGKKESLLYCLGANALEELGCIILCCKAPPDAIKDILFYENMCEKLQINKHGEIIKIKDITTNSKKSHKEIKFFDFLMPQPTAKIDRQRAADLCFLLYPLEEGKATVLELFLHFEVDFKYTPMKMVTYFIKKIVRNMYDNIVKCCKNYEKSYSHIKNKNKEFYDWLDTQIQRFLKNKNDVRLIDTISLRSYNEPETNE